jgi:hypothetical protein
MSNRIKASFVCRKVEDYTINQELVASYTPKAGDVAIFKVIEANGSYIVGKDKLNTTLFNGDTIMLAFGSRYATSQLEGYVPNSPVQTCHLLGRGGVAGVLKSLNSKMRSEPPQLEVVGYACNAHGNIINTIEQDKLASFDPMQIKSKIILSIGSSMDSGKTTTAAYLCGGLNKAEHKVAYLKLTGTAFPKDARFVYDRGANYVADFSHFGYPSTFMFEKNELLDLYQSLVNLAQQAVSPEFIVIEIADGLLQRETAMLLQDEAFMSSVHSVIFSCGDSLGVFSGLQMLEKLGIEPFAISGLFTASDLLIEEVEQQLSVPVLRLSQLLDGEALDCLKLQDLKKGSFIAQRA